MCTSYHCNWFLSVWQIDSEHLCQNDQIDKNKNVILAMLQNHGAIEEKSFASAQ